MRIVQGVKIWSRSSKWKSHQRSFAKTDTTEAGLIRSPRRKRTPSNRCKPRALHTHISRRRSELPSGAHPRLQINMRGKKRHSVSHTAEVEQHAGDAMGSSPTGCSPIGGSGVPLGLNIEDAGPREKDEEAGNREHSDALPPAAFRDELPPDPAPDATPPTTRWRLFSSARICIVLPPGNRPSTLAETPPSATPTRRAWPRLGAGCKSLTPLDANAPHAPPPHPHTSAHPHM
ncbi:hypothetical protein DFH09DRAFT_1182962 [Mycena vulgaris]|nr:hypothetical protein DFH09DRAFT_1182962 [Mycena vulgaris]